VQEPGPECIARQRRDFVPVHAGGKHRADQASGAGSSDDRRADAGFGENFEDANMSQPSHGAAAQSQSDTMEAKPIETTHQDLLYPAS